MRPLERTRVQILERWGRLNWRDWSRKPLSHRDELTDRFRQSSGKGSAWWNIGGISGGDRQPARLDFNLGTKCHEKRQFVRNLFQAKFRLFGGKLAEI